jgi:hypothetical protein
MSPSISLLVFLLYAVGVLVAAVVVVEGFVTSNNVILQRQRQRQSFMDLAFGLPSFSPKSNDEDDEINRKSLSSLEQSNKIGLGGLIQLITAGAGAPFLGEFQGVEKETGKFIFSLEANNLVDENGESKQTKMPYFESGWVDPEDLAKERKRKEQKGSGFKFPW